jgi:hypothetical protein
MTNYVSHSNEIPLLKLSGKISSYDRKRLSASFVFTESDQTKIGVLAVASATAGLAGHAAIMSNYSSAMEEEADYVQFELDGKRIKGWLWRSPFKEGDEVVVAVEKKLEHYELYGMMRPMDKVIALCPHCSRGRIRHIKTIVKWWFILVPAFFLLFLLLPITGGYLKFWEFWGEIFKGDPSGWFIILGLIAFFVAMFASLGRKWMPFVRLAEKVFRILELPSPSNIDLKKSTKLHKTENNPPECGVMYFKY